MPSLYVMFPPHHTTPTATTHNPTSASNTEWACSHTEIALDRCPGQIRDILSVVVGTGQADVMNIPDESGSYCGVSARIGELDAAKRWKVGNMSAFCALLLWVSRHQGVSITQSVRGISINRFCDHPSQAVMIFYPHHIRSPVVPVYHLRGSVEAKMIGPSACEGHPRQVRSRLVVVCVVLQCREVPTARLPTGEMQLMRTYGVLRVGFRNLGNQSPARCQLRSGTLHPSS